MRNLAYLDAGTGSMIAQAVVAGAAGVAVVAKVGWRRMAGGFRKSSPQPTQEHTETAPTEVVDSVDAR